MAIRVYGHSDDMVVVQGQRTHELTRIDVDDFIVVASDGSMFSGSYSDGRFAFEQIAMGGKVEHKIGEGEDSDVLIFDADWVSVGSKMA